MSEGYFYAKDQLDFQYSTLQYHNLAIEIPGMCKYDQYNTHKRPL